MECKILYDDRSSNDEQLSITTFLWKTKNTNLGVWLSLEKMKFVTVSDHEHTYKFYLNRYFV
jgi:hypothetical protein